MCLPSVTAAASLCQIDSWRSHCSLRHKSIAASIFAHGKRLERDESLMVGRKEQENCSDDRNEANGQQLKLDEVVVPVGGMLRRTTSCQTLPPPTPGLAFNLTSNYEFITFRTTTRRLGREKRK
jgi:hypothetical protein